jgi:hypothetical protein
VAGYYACRARDTDRWLRGMNKLLQRIESELDRTSSGLATR